MFPRRTGSVAMATVSDVTKLMWFFSTGKKKIGSEELLSWGFNAHICILRDTPRCPSWYGAAGSGPSRSCCCQDPRSTCAVCSTTEILNWPGKLYATSPGDLNISSSVEWIPKLENEPKLIEIIVYRSVFIVIFCKIKATSEQCIIAARRCFHWRVFCIWATSWEHVFIWYFYWTKKLNPAPYRSIFKWSSRVTPGVKEVEIWEKDLT